MAIYKGREVTILGPLSGEDSSRMYRILEQGNQTTAVPFNQLQLTDKEVADMKKQNVNHLDGANVVKDKDVQDLRDSQDPKKIEEKQKKNPKTDEPVKATTYVKPSEVKAA